MFSCASIVRGAADDSYGIEVAKLAGSPGRARFARAKTYLQAARGRAPPPLDGGGAGKAGTRQSTPSPTAGADAVGRILRSTDINSLTPLEALNLLSELQQKARG